MAAGAANFPTFVLHHGYVPSTPVVDMAQVFHLTLQSALDSCAAIAPCAAVSFPFAGTLDPTAAEPVEARWYAYKRFPPGGAALPAIWPDPAWRTYLRIGAPPSPSVRQDCAAHECGGAQPACAPNDAPAWGWVARAAGAAQQARSYGFVNDAVVAQHVLWFDGALESFFFSLAPGARQSVRAYGGARWRVRTAPPESRLVREVVSGRALVLPCACAAALAAHGLDAAALGAAAHGGGGGGDERAGGGGSDDGGEGGAGGASDDTADGALRELDPSTAMSSCAAADESAAEAAAAARAAASPAPSELLELELRAPPRLLDAATRAAASAAPSELLELELYNAAPQDARVVRARWAREGGSEGCGARLRVCVAGEVGAGLALALDGVRLGDVYVACALGAEGRLLAGCAAPLLVHAVEDVRLADCARDESGTGGPTSCRIADRGPRAAVESPPVDTAARHALAAELAALALERAQLTALVQDAHEALKEADEAAGGGAQAARGRGTRAPVGAGRDGVAGVHTAVERFVSATVDAASGRANAASGGTTDPARARGGTAADRAGTASRTVAERNQTAAARVRQTSS
jgi:hypothetical protein